MSGIYTALQTALTGLNAFSTSVGVVSDNISNANNKDYAARRAEFEYQVTGGSKISGIQREVDAALLRSTLTATSTQGADEVKQTFFDDFERKLGTIGGSTPINDILQEFVNSWRSFEANPELAAARYDVVRTAQSFISELQRLSSGLDESSASIGQQITQDVSDFNTALREFSRLNGEVARLKSSGRESSALENQREKQLHIIAKYVPVKISEQPSGHQFIFGPTYSLVGITPSQFSWDATTQVLSRTDTGNQDYTNRIYGGRLGAIIDLARSDNASIDNADRSIGFVEKLRFQLDEISRQFTNEAAASVRSSVQFQNSSVPLGQLPGTSLIAGAGGIIQPGTITLTAATTDAVFDSTIGNVFVGTSVSGSTGNQISITIGAGATLDSVVSAINQVGGLSSEFDTRGRIVINSDLETAITVDAGATGFFGTTVTSQTLTPDAPPSFARSYNRAGLDAQASFNITPTAGATSGIVGLGASATIGGSGISTGTLSFTQRDQAGNVVRNNTVAVASTSTPAQLLASINAQDGITALYDPTTNALNIRSNTGGNLTINPGATNLFPATANYNAQNIATTSDITNISGAGGGTITFTTTPISGGAAVTQTVSVTAGLTGAQLIANINALTNISAVADTNGNISVSGTTGQNLVINAGATGLFGAGNPAIQTFSNKVSADELRGSFFTRYNSLKPHSRINIKVADELIARTSTVKRSSGTVVNAALASTNRNFDEAAFTQSSTDYSRLAVGWLNDVIASGRRTKETASTSSNVFDEINKRYKGKVNVSLDTELARLTILQNSYTAMARVVNASDAMLRALEAVVR